MRTKEEVYDLIFDLNEDAHSEAYDSWVAADEAEDNGEDMDVVESMREDASIEQAGYFREMLEQYPGLLEEATLYAEQDESFAMDWEAWYCSWLDEDDE